jgi:hypothetical protein
MDSYYLSGFACFATAFRSYFIKIFAYKILDSEYSNGLNPIAEIATILI